MPQRPALSTLLIVLALPACAIRGGGRFACPHPAGVTCMSPAAIYRATDDRRHLETDPGRGAPFAAAPPSTTERPPDDAGRGVGADELRRAVDPGYRIAADGLRLVEIGARATAVELAPEETPYRTAAQVLRIWIAPWEDEAGDLHLASRIYTEIEGRRWLVAESPARQRGTTVMQRVFSPAATRPDPPPPTSAPPSGQPDAGGAMSPARK